VFDQTLGSAETLLGKKVVPREDEDAMSTTSG
jgi:hypothetical protein